MNELQTFNHNLFGKLDVVMINGEEMFNLNNVAWSLGYTRKSKGTDYLRYDRIANIIKKLSIATVDRSGQLYINESGLYDFIFEAGTDRAREFRKWVTEEVLPSIRKHGAYMTTEVIEEALLNPDTIINLATNLKKEQQERKWLEQQKLRDEPYTTFGKVVANSDASINIGAFAKLLYDKHGIKIGRNKLFAWLRNKGYLIKTGREKNQPKQQYMEQGLFDTTTTLVSRTQGDMQSVTTFVTGKGQVEIAKKLLQEFSDKQEVI